MENKYLWATEEIFGSIEEWNKAFEIAKTSYDFSVYKGKLGDADEFFKCMKEDEKISRALDKLSVYAMMKHDENTKDSQFDALLSKVTALGAKIGAATAYIVPELTSLPDETLVDFIGNPKLKDYDYMLKGILKAKDHVLSESEEEMLAMLGETTASFRDIFTKIDNADLPLKTVKSGKDIIPLSHGTYGVIMHGEDRALRKKAYNKYYGAYLSLMNTISATYYGSVKKDVFYAKAKKHSSALEAALFNEDVPKVVYDNLISSVEKALPTLHAYMREKKKLLKLKRMYMYDVYVPVVEGAEMKLDYDKAYDLVVKGLQPLGKEYQDLLVKAKNERWLDVYEKDGKRSGAYSVAVFDTHPYVLLNYQKTTHDIFTIAHEMGHSIHSYFSNRTQPYAKADYRIFVAEVASTVNEVLLIKHLLATEKDKKLKKYLLSYLLEMIRTTLFRQTQFAEFEQRAHALAEQGEALTKENLSDLYYGLNQQYYGEGIIHDEQIRYEWARIPHFYNSFYVYKYATGIISAVSIVKRILTEGESAVQDYFAFLSSGGCDDPVSILKKAGVDLTTKEPFKAAMAEFKDTLEEFKALL